MMKIKKDTVVTIDYTLFDTDGSVLEASDLNEPLVYLHGHRNLVSGLERELEGKSAGAAFDVTIPPADAYGEISSNLIQDVPLDRFPKDSNPQPGMQFHGQTANGMAVFTVKDVKDDIVTIDGNHELAGRTLKFEVTVRDVRSATPDEIDHGHVHGPGCHH